MGTHIRRIDRKPLALMTVVMILPRLRVMTTPGDIEVMSRRMRNLSSVGRARAPFFFLGLHRSPSSLELNRNALSI